VKPPLGEAAIWTSGPQEAAYQTTSKTRFGSLVGMATAPISGTSQSIGSVPPNIDFYPLLDNSPSMAIATTDGIDTMVAKTPDKRAFGCHESDTSPNDCHGLARSLGVTLRMDLLRQATQNLMATAQTTSLSAAQSQAANIDIYEVPYQNWNNDISPFQANMGPTLKSCASPGLYFQVSTDQDISAAMIALFNAAVKTAYLSK
jgi:hypothetical protein